MNSVDDKNTSTPGPWQFRTRYTPENGAFFSVFGPLPAGEPDETWEVGRVWLEADALLITQAVNDREGNGPEE